MTGVGEKRSTGCQIILWSAATLTIIVIAVVTVLVIIVWRGLQPQPPPDLRDIMAWPAIRARQRIVANWMTPFAAGIQERDSSLIPQGQTLIDHCTVGSFGEGFMAHSGFSVRCDRWLTRYYAFDGPLKQRLAQLNADLKRSGVAGLAPCSRPGYLNPPRVPRPATCGVLPRSRAVVDYAWLRHGDPVDADTAIIGVMPTGSQPGARPGWERAYVQHEVNATATVRHAFQSHPYCLILFFDEGYYSVDHWPPSSPPGGAPFVPPPPPSVATAAPNPPGG